MNTKISFGLIKLLLLSGGLFAGALARAQTPFLRTGQVFMILENTNELQEFSIQPGYNSINAVSLGSLPPGGFDAIGFRRTDNLLYGIATANNHLFKVGQNAVYQDLGPVGLDNNLYYLAGDVSVDGRYLYSVGSDAAGANVHLAITDLDSGGFSTQFVPLSSAGHLADIAFDPTTGVLFGFDEDNNQVVTISPGNGFITALQTLHQGNTLYGLYFDAFGDMYGLGSTLSGIVDGYFKLDKTTGKETRLTTGPTSMVADMASCPYSIELKNDVDPNVNLPCTEEIYSYSLVNGSEETVNGVEFLHALPSGFHFAGVLQNTFGALVDTLSVPGSLRMQNLTLTPGIRDLKIKVAVGDIPKGRYNSQPIINGLPPLYGLSSRSDYAAQPGFEDSTIFLVNRFDKDSLDFKWLLCHGESLLLESSDYGNNVLWNNGSMVSDQMVTKGGLFSFIAGSTCEKIVVLNEVTSVTCPFTIAVAHVFEPDTSFACSDLIFRYIISNDSGEPREHLSFTDTLPAGFEFIELVKNPFDGALTPNNAPNIFCLNGMTLPVGKDTLDVKVHVGDVPPGDYKNRAVLFGLPVLMGPIRLSDNPHTFQFDSSTLHIQGALFDSMFFKETICENMEITLDASSLGKTFLWDDGSKASSLLVNAPGNYHLTLFDGCTPAQIFWDIAPGAAIKIEAVDDYQIHQGESIQLHPQISNQGDSLHIQWTDPLSNSLSCGDCSDPHATPLNTAEYGIKISNESCADSTFILVTVDESRRIYAPNIFSPNDDGENDAFFLQSPDFGNVKAMRIYDRWGNLVFETRNATLQDDALHWNGRYQNKPLPPGVYLWMASIEFIDGKQQLFKGDVTIVR